ncbi:MAG: hypothetical protein LBH04_10830 [Tannerellaceae bacterium]|jgi:hypothetical protein|nr:hypothetical protein [Tannerellaceae bacterium]
MKEQHATPRFWEEMDNDLMKYTGKKANEWGYIDLNQEHENYNLAIVDGNVSLYYGNIMTLADAEKLAKQAAQVKFP